MDYFGLSGAGKTSISNTIYKILKNKYGKTLYVNGDEMRKILDLKSLKIWIERKGQLNIRNYLKKLQIKTLMFFLLVWLYLMKLGYGIEKISKIIWRVNQTDIKNNIKKNLLKFIKKKEI